VETNDHRNPRQTNWKWSTEATKNTHSIPNEISLVVRHNEGPPQSGGLMGTAENAGFNATAEWNLQWSDFVTKQHKSSQKTSTS